MMKIAVIAVLSMLMSSPLYCQLSAVVRDVSGKVTVGTPERGWEAAGRGTSISEGTYISTGFGSEAVLELGPTVLRVRQLTRMRLEEFVQREKTISTGPAPTEYLN